MKKRSYTLKHNHSEKKHKFLRGIRCYASSLIFSKHTTKPDEYIELPVNQMLMRLSPYGSNVCLLSFHKARHSALIICTAFNSYAYLSVYSSRVTFEECLSEEEASDIITFEAQHWGDVPNNENMVYIGKLDTREMINTIYSMMGTYHYSLLSSNCSRFAADVLLAGCKGKTGRFQHDRPWQMPANTLELAREIARFQQSCGLLNKRY